MISVSKFKDLYETMIRPQIYCNDQEPLDFDYYQSLGLTPLFLDRTMLEGSSSTTANIPTPNIRYRYWDIFDDCILLHSEKNSKDLLKYQQNNFIPVYYWSHAVIARDWFRYAEHVRQTKSVKKHFLIYNRAWTGTREYRLKFADMLIDYQLVNQCQTSVGLTDQGVYYRNHSFTNPFWKPIHQLEHHFEENFTTSCYSADFDLSDYESTDIEVVLETLFDDSRLHLTEKSLRPIALGQPFILAGTPGSLEYLKSYGFKTFNSVFSEEYDTIANPEKRLTAIIQLMKSISEWSDEQRLENVHRLRLIAQYNQQHFFSDAFFDHVTNELKNNLSDGLHKLLKNNTSKRFFNLRKSLYVDPKVHSRLVGEPNSSIRKVNYSIVKTALKFKK